MNILVLRCWSRSNTPSLQRQESKFVRTTRQYARVRLRDGAYKWGTYRDVEGPIFVEIFLVHSWAEHQRQHEQQTKADHDLEQRVYSYVAGEPKVRHLLYAVSTKL
jgi:Transmembrane secretion effector